MKATINGTVIAESDDTVYIEGNQYFPMSSVNEEMLTKSDTQYHCPWKGDAQYYDINDSKDAAWQYPNPLPSAELKVKRDISDLVAFDKSQVEVA
jgi:uncharacterized protein (DUF427 family)